MKKHTRTLAIAIAVIMLLTILLSSFFIALEHNHDCSGDDCPICLQLDFFENLLKTVSSGIIAIGMMECSCRILRIYIKKSEDTPLFYNLVSMKIKLLI